MHVHQLPLSEITSCECMILQLYAYLSRISSPIAVRQIGVGKACSYPARQMQCISIEWQCLSSLGTSPLLRVTRTAHHNLVSDTPEGGVSGRRSDADVSIVAHTNSLKATPNRTCLGACVGACCASKLAPELLHSKLLKRSFVGQPLRHTAGV